MRVVIGKLFWKTHLKTFYGCGMWPCRMIWGGTSLILSGNPGEKKGVLSPDTSTLRAWVRSPCAATAISGRSKKLSETSAHTLHLVLLDEVQADAVGPAKAGDNGVLPAAAGAAHGGGVELFKVGACLRPGRVGLGDVRLRQLQWEARVEIAC